MTACSICLEPELREPAACIPCGHTFCHACITRWIQSQSALTLQFGPKKCPQCRVSIGGVQKLYLPDQPTMPQNQAQEETPSFISPWQQLRLCLGYIWTHVCLTLQLLKQLTMKKCEDFVAVTTRFFTQAAQFLQQCCASLRRDWYDLSDSSRGCIIAVGILILAFILQDIQQERGIFSCVIAPMVSLVYDVIQQIVGTAVFLVVRSLLVLMNCGCEIVFGLAEMVYAILEMIGFVLFDLLCVPWVLITACVQLISVIVCGLFGFIQRVITSCLICLALCFIISMLQEDWQNVFSNLALTTVDWVLEQLPEERMRDREGINTGMQPEGREVLQHRLAVLFRAAMIVLQRELRRRGQVREEARRDMREEPRQEEMIHLR